MSEHCRICGKFVNIEGAGVSWCQTYTHFDLNDPTYRCSDCTDKHGIAVSNCNPKAGPWSGRNPKNPAHLFNQDALDYAIKIGIGA